MCEKLILYLDSDTDPHLNFVGCFTYQETLDAIDSNVKEIHTTITHFLQFRYAKRLFVKTNGELHEITIGACDGTDKEIHKIHNIEHMLLNGVFDWYRCRHIMITDDNGERNTNKIRYIEAAENLVNKFTENNVPVTTTRILNTYSMEIKIPVGNKTASIFVYNDEFRRPRFVAKDNCEIFNKNYFRATHIKDIDKFYTDVVTYLNSINKREV